MAVATFRVINSELSGREFTLPDHPFIVGRTSSNDIVIPDQSVSRQHVRGEVKDNHLVLTDLGSHNGIVIGGLAVRETVVPTGGRFELGDIAIEFRLDPADQPVGAAAPAPAPDPSEPEPTPDQDAPPPPQAPGEYAMVQPGTLPSERPVYLDDLFGPGVGDEAGPGEQEKAAVQGAWGALKYLAVIAVLLALGVIAWQVAGGSFSNPAVKSLTIKVGERRVIDLGLKSRRSGGRLIPYIDEGERYVQADVIAGDERIALFEMDKTKFMATVEGVDYGSTDFKLRSGARKMDVRVIVAGDVERKYAADRIPQAERMARAKRLIESGRMAERSQLYYRAVQHFRNARDVVYPLKAGPGRDLYRQADKFFRAARLRLSEQVEDIKFQALVRWKDSDLVGAARQYRKLQTFIPDPEDELSQKLMIIRERTRFEARRRRGR